MSFTTDFDKELIVSERQFISTLSTPTEIQAFLDELPYTL